MNSGMYSVTNMFPVQNYCSSCLYSHACHIKYSEFQIPQRD